MGEKMPLVFRCTTLTWSIRGSSPRALPTRILRSFASFSKGPSTPWERTAVQVKNVVPRPHRPLPTSSAASSSSTPAPPAESYMDLIRQTHDPSWHIKTIEDELKETMGKALGKQGAKILHFLRLMQEEYQNYQQHLQQRHTTTASPKDSSPTSSGAEVTLRSSAQRFNQLRQQALQARWELMVHRQALGLLVDNHNYVHRHYPIAEALPLDSPSISPTGSSSNSASPDSSSASTTTKTSASPSGARFSDQLDWWQRVGRWK